MRGTLVLWAVVFTAALCAILVAGWVDSNVHVQAAPHPTGMFDGD